MFRQFKSADLRNTIEELIDEQSEAVERAAAALAQVPEYEAKLARVFAQMNALPARTARMRERFS